MVEKKYRGVIVPMITPFTKEGKIDQPAVVRVCNHLIEHGAAPFILGTTGESASIPESARPGFAEALVKAAAERCLTYAGISSTSLETSVTAAKKYFDLGIDVFVAHPPAYYPLSNSQLLRYFEALAEQIPGPLILYNITSVTHVSIPLEVVDRLSQHSNIVGLKDSERDEKRLKKALKMWANRSDFSYLIGWGSQMAFGLLHGSNGIVPSSGNLVPELYSELYQAALKKDLEKVEALQSATNEISLVYQQGRTLSESLAGLKVLMNEMNLCEPFVLPPLYRLEKKEEQKIIEKKNRFRKNQASARSRKEMD